MKKTLLIVLILAVVSYGTYFFLNPVPPLIQSVVQNKVVQRDESLHNPKILEIPKLKVKAPIEHVGELPNGEMDVPKNYGNTAWYKDGYRPGEMGNAVIAGHFDTPQGAPDVFAQLGLLEKGDIIIVWEGDKSVMFTVDRVETYPASGFPVQLVFGKTNRESLNLITCTGMLSNGEYQDRLVVYTTKI